MPSNFYGGTGLIGGAAGDLDNIDGAGLANLDGAFVVDDFIAYLYSLDADSAAAEDSPKVISPDANAGDKRWILESLAVNALTAYGAISFDGGAFVFNNSEADKDFRVAALNITNAFFIQGSDGKVGISTPTVPHGGVGAAMLALDGANSSVDGPHIQFTTASDDYPLLHVMPYRHDNVTLAFDSYFEGAWKSSDAGSNFQITKTTDLLKITYDSGIAAGNAVTWNNGIVLDTSGKVFINDIANAKALGPSFTIDGAGQDGEYLTLQDSTDVAHGCTTRSETNTFYTARKQHSTDGGFNERIFTEATIAWSVEACATTVDTTKANNSHASIFFAGYKISGTGFTDMDANSNVFGIKGRIGAATRTLLLVDMEGEIHTDAIIGVGDDWDEWDDLALASDLSRLPKARFNEMMKYKVKDFEKAGLLTLSVDEEGTQHAFIRHKAMLQFSMCCFSDIQKRFNIYERAFERVSQKLGIPKMELLALGN